MDKPEGIKSWEKLKNIVKNTKINIEEEYKKDCTRSQKYSVKAGNIILDYSKNIINSEVYQTLLDIAEEAKIKDKIQKMYSGEKINNTEQRQVMHINLRAGTDRKIENYKLIHDARIKMFEFVKDIHCGIWKGFSGKIIENVIHIGIGGSFLGPKLISEALMPYSIKNDIKISFVSNIDGNSISKKLKDKNPETTLFIVASKSFSTQETLTNAITAKKWLEESSGENQYHNNMIAITQNEQCAIDFGIKPDNILPMWEWVGGRYSIWSSVGLVTAIQIGIENFNSMLKGAEIIDQHFLEAPNEINLPMILGLIGVLNINFFNYPTNAIIPYDHSLRALPAYIQQLDMESNGKSVNIDGVPIKYNTAAINWGSEGTNGQHAFHQHLLQSNTVTPVDFIIAMKCKNEKKDHHRILISNCLAQSQALMQGESLSNLKSKFPKSKEQTLNHKTIKGNRPSNTILLKELDPSSIGSLLAIYEHKTFTQGAIWNINSFDQWGVELGKRLNKNILDSLSSDNQELLARNHSSTNHLLEIIKQHI